MSIYKFARQSKLKRSREIKGLFYILPFLIGFFLFIFVPMLQAVRYSFSNLTFRDGLQLEFVGLKNYKTLFFVDTEFRKILLDSLSNSLVNIPIILVFSMLIAVFLNGEFAGQPIFQLLFFIPVILSSGIMPSLYGNDQIRVSVINASSMVSDQNASFNVSSITAILSQLNLGAGLIDYISYAISNILTVLNSSGIQILVCLIALKSIPASLFEAASVEGATGWECFWKITFPMVMPHVFVNVVYTIIDSFANNENGVMRTITSYNYERFEYGYAAATAWTYFGIITMILLLSIAIVKFIIKRYD